MKTQNKNNLQLVFLLLSLICISTVQSELIFVNEIFRHGARGTIVDDIWTSEIPIQKWMKEELTPTGMRQHYTLGQQLRKHYIDDLQFLDKELNYNQIFVRCTDFNRTLQSALSQLYGLYPPQSGISMNDLVAEEDKLAPFKGAQQPDLLNNRALPNLATPVPIHVRENIISYPPAFCPNYKQIQADWLKDHKAMQDKLNLDYKDTFASFKTLLNYEKPLDLSNIEDIWDIMIANLNNGQEMPKGLTQDLWRNLTQLDTLDWFFNQYGSEEATQIQNTNTFRSFRDNMDQAIKNDQNKEEGRTDLKWAMYSGHDNNVAGAMLGVQATDLQCNLDNFFKGSNDALNCNMRPYFAASVIIELHKIKGKYMAAVKFDGTYINVCGKKQQYCEYNEFKEKVLNKQILSQDQLNKLCKTSSSSNDQNTAHIEILSNSTSSAISQYLLYSVVVLIAFIVVNGVHKMFQSKKKQTVLSQELPSFSNYREIDLDTELESEHVTDLV